MLRKENTALSFEVVVDDLRRHSGHLEGLMDRLATAVAAADTVSMDDGAYGLLCGFLPSIVNPMEQEGIDALKAATAALGNTADNVRMAVNGYEDVDQANAQPFTATLTARSPVVG